jgi:uncharacterized protein
MTGHPEQPPSGHEGFPPEPGTAGYMVQASSPPPGDQHHEHVPRTGLGLGLSGPIGGAGRARAAYGRAGPDSDQLWSMMAYLGMIFFLFMPPLIVYLAKRRESPFVRYHAAQALNLWTTGFLYTVSCAILGGLLALDTVTAALAVGLPLVSLVWVLAAGYAIMGAVTASRGRQHDLPRWICSPAVR